MNYSLLGSGQEIQLTDGVIQNDLGFQMGTFIEYDVLNFLSFKPRLGLTFNNANVFIVGPAFESQDYRPLGNTLDISGNFILKEFKKKVGVFAAVGVTY